MYLRGRLRPCNHCGHAFLNVVCQGDGLLHHCHVAALRQYLDITLKTLKEWMKAGQMLDVLDFHDGVFGSC